MILLLMLSAVAWITKMCHHTWLVGYDGGLTDLWARLASNHDPIFIGGSCRPQKWPHGEEWSGQEILYCRVERGCRGLNTPQWDSAWSDWLGSYGSCWFEVGAEGEFKLDLKQDHDPGKQKLKGAVRTKTYRRHYCQQEPHTQSWKFLIRFFSNVI
jgi:hypothetical protein